MKKLFSILTVLTISILFTACGHQRARLHLTGNNMPVIVEWDWDGYKAGDTIMLRKDTYDYGFRPDVDHYGEMRDAVTHGVYMRSDSSTVSYGAVYRVAVIEEIME